MDMKKFLFALLAGVLLSPISHAFDAVKAKQNYDRYCAACHGFNGMSVMPDAPNLRLNQGLMQSDQQIVQKLKTGSTRKPPFIGLINERELLDIVIYSRTIK